MIICWSGLFLCLSWTILTNCKSVSQEPICSFTKSNGFTIHVKISLARGMESHEPVHTNNINECHAKCCSGLKAIGGKPCNFMTFKSTSTSSDPNCYLFYCPSKSACPLMSSQGLISHIIKRDQQDSEKPNKQPTSKNTPTAKQELIQTTKSTVNVIVANTPRRTMTKTTLPTTLSTTTTVSTTLLKNTTTLPSILTVKNTLRATIPTTILTTNQPIKTKRPITNQPTRTSTTTQLIKTTTTIQPTTVTMTIINPPTVQSTKTPTNIKPNPTTIKPNATAMKLNPTTIKPTPVPTTMKLTTTPTTTIKPTPVPTTMKLTTTPTTTIKLTPVLTTMKLTTTPITIKLTTTRIRTTVQSTKTTTTIKPTPVPTTMKLTTTRIPTTTQIPTTVQSTTTTTPTTIKLTTTPIPTTIQRTTTTIKPTTITPTTTIQPTPTPTMNHPTKKITTRTTQQYTGELSRIPDAHSSLKGISAVVSTTGNISKRTNGKNAQDFDLGNQDISGGKQEDSQMAVQGLIADLVFGIMFLIVVVFVLSKLVIESFNRRHYKKLDYLMDSFSIDA